MRRVALVAGLIGCVVWWRHHAPVSTHTDSTRQAAVLADGFAVRDGSRVVELDLTGTARATHSVPVDRALRVVGTGAGPAAGWIANGQLQIMLLARGEVDGSWGKDARTLCDGVATNDHRFGIGFLESNGGLWWVHGPVSAEAASASEPVRVATHAEPSWCAIASARERIAIAWRERDRFLFNTCSPTKCSALPASVKLARQRQIVGFNCLSNACLIATREGTGLTELVYATESGAVKWRFEIKATGPVSIVGIDDSAFAVAIPGEVLRFDRGGRRSTLWIGGSSPALAWSRGRLLVAHDRGNAILQVPR